MIASFMQAIGIADISRGETAGMCARFLYLPGEKACKHAGSRRAAAGGTCIAIAEEQSFGSHAVESRGVYPCRTVSRGMGIRLVIGNGNEYVWPVLLLSQTANGGEKYQTGQLHVNVKITFLFVYHFLVVQNDNASGQSAI